MYRVGIRLASDPPGNSSIVGLMLGSVGAPLHMEHKRAIAEVLPHRLYELYGLTEGFMTILDRDDVYHCRGLLALGDLDELCRVDRPELKFSPHTARIPPALVFTFPPRDAVYSPG